MILDAQELPSTWDRAPVSAHFRRVSRKGFQDKQLLSVYREHGVVPRGFTDDNWNLVPTELTSYQLVEPGDLAINKMKAWQGSLGISQLEGVVSPAYFIYKPTSRCFDERYLNYLIRSPLMAAEFARLSDGVRPQQWDLDPKAFERVPLPQPPLDEQARIADYLDRETATIDALIEKQQRLLRLLEERRATVRKHFALCGLNDGIESVAAPEAWAGAIPSHWDFVPLMSVSRLGSGHTPSKSRPELWVDTTIPWISLRDVGSMRGSTYIHETHTSISELGLALSSARLLPAGTVVLSRDATIGRTAIMGRDMATSQHFAAWTCGRDLIPEYLHLVLSGALQDHLDSLTDGSTLRTIGMGDIRSLRIPLPPVDEQQEIVKSSDRETATIDALIAKAERFIELAQERRASLITAAVTGQIEIPTED